MHWSVMILELEFYLFYNLERDLKNLKNEMYKCNTVHRSICYIGNYFNEIGMVENIKLLIKITNDGISIRAFTYLL